MRGLGLVRRSGYIYEGRKIFWILLSPIKNGSKQKDFAGCAARSSVPVRSALLIARALKNILRRQLKSVLGSWLLTSKLGRRTDLQIMRKWILASLRRASERYAILSYSYVTVAQSVRGLLLGRKKKNVFQQNLWAMRA